MTYYAHTNGEDTSRWQLLKDHLQKTAELAYQFGEACGTSELSFLAGKFHDIGKYTTAFQKRLFGSPQTVDHSTAGGKEIVELTKHDKLKAVIGILLAYCIIGHHAGLPDYGSPLDIETDGTLSARLKKRTEDFSAYKTEIDFSQMPFPAMKLLKRSTKSGSFTLSFLTRMLYSTLVDADFQETENFMTRGQKKRGGYNEITWFRDTFNKFLNKFDRPANPIDEKRTEILQACIANAKDKPGFFTLTVPTGGGKTFASMAFALNHAAENELNRIIYVIPYTSIIEQNAADFKQVLGEANVLEHHSNFDWSLKRQQEFASLSDDKTNRAIDKLKLAAENWDIPVVVTTNVQFFESLYANRSRGCRKIHNLAKSVIIFDEAQMLPMGYYKPCLYSVYELVSNYGASAIFCTATQPEIEQFLPNHTQLKELAPDPRDLYKFFKRVQVQSIGKITDQELISRINQNQQVLCIVNTRRHAKGLYALMDEDSSFHLSTLMCPAHRKETIKEIKRRLKESLTCRVVSTQIMEAGIDVDFPTGYRAESGLDSIVQAAGRVNREGKHSFGIMYVFEPDSEFVMRTPAYIQQGAAVARNILRNFREDPISLEAIQAYYNQLYSLQGKNAFDMKDILACFERGIPEFDFQTAAEKFKIIESPTVAVIIPYNNEARELLEQLKFSEFPKPLLRQLQRYTIHIYEREFEALQSLGLIDTYAETYSVLNDFQRYHHPKTGLMIPEGNFGNAIFFDEL